MAIKTFTTGEVLTAADTNTYLANSGLVYVASQTFSAAGFVEFQNCFTSTYDNYRVVFTWYGSSATNLSTQYMTGTNTRDIAGTYNRFGWYWLGGIVNFNSLGITSDFVANHGTASAEFSSAEIVFFRPNVSGVRTNSSLTSYSGDSGLSSYLTTTKNATLAYTGLYVYPNAGTITGTVTVYGYRKP